VDELVQQMQDAGGTHCSATPSFWRRLLIFASPPALTRIPFRQITLGGEPVDQLLLDQLHGLYPQARLVHIYATTELGRCFSVNDGLAGFPAEYLTAGRLSDVELQIRDNQLFVRSPNRATEVLNVTSATSNLADCHEGWTPTGDVVRLAGERVQFDGRLGEMINVGGNKVRPLLVESVIRSVNPVQDVLVYGQPSSIAGQIVACQVVIGTGMDEDWARQQIQLACEQQLQRHERPRLIQFVPRIDLTAAGKKRRNAAQ
jgi:acyl-CoA synthetase (AMP-forming)/AMP-acid ligase II